MIRVNKPHDAPHILNTKGKAKRQEHVAAYNRGERQFEFDTKIYGHKTVKEALIKSQHDKCFLCESKITHISHGDVEHFRPKAAYRQSTRDTLHTGYYWLAYEWSNLFLACPVCNQVFKKNLFPLSNPTARATSHRKSLSKEKPLFLDPSIDDPEQHISFREEVPFPLNGSVRGKATITDLGLKRLKLNDRRREHYDRLQLLYKVARMNPPTPQSAAAQTLLDRAVLDSAEYASMTRAALKANFEPVV
ncbi:MAG TPA: hypothetical protein VF656_06435 [Pyrinomonadaceae bacterium]|jgi:uncharacterized protein (TIGR02646 family)